MPTITVKSWPVIGQKQTLVVWGSLCSFSHAMASNIMNSWSEIFVVCDITWRPKKLFPSFCYWDGATNHLMIFQLCHVGVKADIRIIYVRREGATQRRLIYSNLELEYILTWVDMYFQRECQRLVGAPLNQKIVKLQKTH